MAKAKAEEKARVEAEKEFQRQAKLRAQAESYLGKARDYAGKNKNSHAKNYAKKVLDIYPENSEARLILDEIETAEKTDSR